MRMTAVKHHYRRAMARLALLLRAVNVGGRTVRMADLRELLTDLGYGDVKTHLASGNAVVATRTRPATVAAATSDAIRERLGMDVPVIVRTHAELEVTVSRLAPVELNPSRYFVTFYETAAPAPPLDPEGFLPERWWWHGDELHADCPAGVAESQLFKALGKVKGLPVGTMRNWNTVLAVHRLTA
jgi:uncharacterized protein (DUF1697 family)